MLVAKLGARCARCAAASMGLALGLGAGIPGAHAAGILDAPCTTLGQKLIVTDYQGAAIASNGRGHGMAAFVARQGRRGGRHRLHDAGLVEGQRQG